ncbi:MAG: hypothetical protein KC519_01705 [Anaerolineae bacterium]|nr:hypothetical protein [Anaerolineae bacterium]
MSYFIRYILVRDETTLATIDAALHLIDPDFNIQVDQSEVETGDLYYKSEILGEITVNRPGDSIFEEEIAELRKQLDAVSHPDKPLVQTALDVARAMVALHVLQAGNDNPDILEQLWDWLFEQYPGVLQVDEEGYYDIDGLFLPTTPDE